MQFVSIYFQIPTIVSEKSHQNLLDYMQFLFKKRFEVNKKGIMSDEKMRNSGIDIYDHAHSFVGGDM